MMACIFDDAYHNYSGSDTVKCKISDALSLV